MLSIPYSPNPYPNPNPMVVRPLRGSRVSNGIPSERDEGRGVDQLKWRCGLFEHPVSTVSSLAH